MRLTALAAVLVATLATTIHAATPGLAYQVREGLNENAFLQQGPVAAHLLLRSGKAPRILVAFPAGNSGVGLWFAPVTKDAHWTLTGKPRAVTQNDAHGRPLHGMTAEAVVDAPQLVVKKAVLSSVRVLRDYQGIGRAPAEVDASLKIKGAALTWARDRLDGAPGYEMSVVVTHGAVKDGKILAGADGKIGLRITGLTGETPLTPFAPGGLLNAKAAHDPAARNALTFLSYKEKFLAGSWRFNTYFGRDTLMSVRLLMPALTPQAVETGVGAVLARLSPTGEVAHEEGIGEFAVLDHMKADGSKSDAPTYDYAMIDSSYLLAPVSAAWLLDDPRAHGRATGFLAANDGRYGEAKARGADLTANLRFVLQRAQAFADAPSVEHMISLKSGRDAGEWRDSNTGIGGGRYPYDVNAVLVPAALDSAARLYTSGLLTPYLTAEDKALFTRAAAMAKVWREKTPAFFAVALDHATASKAVADYAKTVGAPDKAALAALGEGGTRFFAISLDTKGQPIPIMNSDTGFELLFAPPSDPEALDKTVHDLMRPFPAGLMTDVGMVVANPAFAPAALQPEFSRNAYHGTVVWSWQQALFASGLERQLARKDLPAKARTDLKAAQSTLWKAIQATRSVSNSELWSWTYEGGRYSVAPFGAAGADADESNAAQLWSTVYLAVKPPSKH